MSGFKSFKQIEDGTYELIVSNEEYPTPGYLLTLSQEGYLLCDEQTEVEWEDEAGNLIYVDIYYFEKTPSRFRTK